jgi:biopolymer transport protein ExbB/TolQ
MYFNFSCPNCSKNLKVRDEFSGRKAKCPYCRATVTVPQRVAPEADSGGEAAAGAAGAAPREPAAESAPGWSPPPSGAAVDYLSGARKPRLPGTSPPGLPRGRRRPAARDERATSDTEDGTNVSVLWTMLCGLAATLVFFALLFPVPVCYYRDLFYARGWVTVAETFLMFWSIAILVFKWIKLRGQRQSMLFDLLPDSIGRDITIENVPRFAANIRDVPVNPGASFLVQRVLRGLEHFTVRRSASEVSTVLASQSDLDNNAVGSSYALLNVFIWAIPILGFIGTVQGLGQAVGNLSGSLQGATDIDSVKSALGGITAGLGVAFDTTLVALIMALFLKFPASSLQKAEEDLLNWVDEYCNENLLKRLKDSGSETPAEAIQRHAEEQQTRIATATAQFVEHTRQVVTTVAEESQATQQRLAQSLQETSVVAVRAAEALAGHFGGLQQAVANLNEVLGRLNGQQVVIQVPPRRRWWHLFSRSDQPSTTAAAATSAPATGEPGSAAAAPSAREPAADPSAPAEAPATTPTTAPEDAPPATEEARHPNGQAER